MPQEKPKNQSDFASFSTKSRGIKNLNFKRPSRPAWRVPNLARFGMLLAALAVGFGGGWAGAYFYSESSSSTSSTAQQKYISGESELISSIAQEVGQSVVSIDVESRAQQSDVFGFPVPTVRSSAGTGFVVSEDGVIVTNRHVIPEGEPDISVTMADGTKYNDITILGRSAGSSSLDIAFLKVNGLGDKKLKPAALGNSAEMEVGDRVVAIGNALGQFENTVTSGIISGFGRDVSAGGGGTQENLSDLFQTDAAINQGNSGGPLVNINGEVIGVNTAVASGAQNIGFAIPINDIKGLIETVLKTGELRQPYLGVRYVSLTADLAYQYNLDVQRGAYIIPSSAGNSILPDSPAEKAGLKEKDIITKVENITIDDNTSLTSALSRYKVGDSINLTVIRNGQTLNLRATLEAIPAD